MFLHVQGMKGVKRPRVLSRVAANLWTIGPPKYYL